MRVDFTSYALHIFMIAIESNHTATSAFVNLYHTSSI